MTEAKLSDNFSNPMSSKEDIHHGIETFDAPVLGHGIPTTGFEGVVDPIFEAKSHALNTAIQHMGWGRYQTKLFLLSGFGWFVDNMYVSGCRCSFPSS